jgi:hypothetical protein
LLIKAKENKMLKWLADKIGSFFEEEEDTIDACTANILMENVDDERIIMFCNSCIKQNFHDPDLFRDIYQAYCNKVQLEDTIEEFEMFIEQCPALINDIKKRQFEIQERSNSLLKDISFRQYKDLTNKSNGKS